MPVAAPRDTRGQVEQGKNNEGKGDCGREREGRGGEGMRKKKKKTIVIDPARQKWAGRDWLTPTWRPVLVALGANGPRFKITFKSKDAKKVSTNRLTETKRKRRAKRGDRR